MPPVYLRCSSSWRRERLERVGREADGQLAGVGVVGVFGAARLQDAREALPVLSGESVRGALGGCGLEVVEVTGLLLEADDALAHVVEEAHRHRVAFRGGDVVFVAT